MASDRALGKRGVVLEPIRPYGAGGKIRVGTEEWRAFAESEQEIAEGSVVEVLRVDGTRLVVRALTPDAASESGGEG